MTPAHSTSVDALPVLGLLADELSDGADFDHSEGVSENDAGQSAAQVTQGGHHEQLPQLVLSEVLLPLPPQTVLLLSGGEGGGGG